MTKVLPPAGLARGLSAQSAIFGIGSGTYLTGSVVFFTVYVGLSPVQVGIGFSVAGLVGLATSLPFGHLADRVGGRRAWVIGALVWAVAFGLYPFAHDFWTFIAVLVLEAMAEVLANAGRGVYTAAALPRGIRVRAMAFNRAYLNVGFTIGAGLGAAALAVDSRRALLVLVLANAAGLVLNAIFVARMPTVHAAREIPADGPRPAPWGVLRDHPYTTLAALIGLLGLHQTIFAEVIPLWAITMTDAPKPVLGGLFALNTVLAVTLQVTATRGADGLAGSTRLMRWAGLATAVACPVIALSGATRGWATIAVLAVGVVLTTATELWSSAAQWYYQTEVPPPEQRGVYVGLSHSMDGVARMVGPASLTFLAIRTGGWGWWLIAALFAACAVAIRPIIAWIDRTPRNGGFVLAASAERAA